jgi:hypothetical protein
VADDITFKTLSPDRKTNAKKMILDGCGKWITGSVQDSIFHSIYCTAMKDALEGDIIGSWKLAVAG